MLDSEFLVVRCFQTWSNGRAAWGAGVVLALALGCGRSVREPREDAGPTAGEGGTDGGAAGSTGAEAGTSQTGGSATAGGAAGTSATGGSSMTGGVAGTPATGGSSMTGGVAGTPATGGSSTAGGEGGAPDVPNHDDFIVRSSLMSAYEGLNVYGTFDQNFGPDSRSDARTDVIANGTFELVWVEGFNRNSFGTYMTLFVDRDSDAVCTPDVDAAWVDFQSNLAAPGSPEILDFDPELDDVPYGPISCDEFNHWFDHDYRPPAP